MISIRFSTIRAIFMRSAAGRIVVSPASSTSDPIFSISIVIMGELEVWYATVLN
jgi:hypothetical protein